MADPPGDVNEEIDDAFYSRQRYVYGDAAMHSLSQGAVCMVGLNALAFETAKNIVLTGPKRVCIVDDGIVDNVDVEHMFGVDAQLIGQSRLSACLPFLTELNSHVVVEGATTVPDDLQQFGCVLVCKLMSFDALVKLDQQCRACDTPVGGRLAGRWHWRTREEPIRESPPCGSTKNFNLFLKLIVCGVIGLMGWIFADFGDQFAVSDSNGERTRSSFIGHITKGSPGLVSTLDDQAHGLCDGDVVRIEQVQGMTQLNHNTYTIKVVNAIQFTVDDTSTMDEYSGGGIVTQVKQPFTVHHKPLTHFQADKPESVITTNFEKFNRDDDLYKCVHHLLRSLNGTQTLPIVSDLSTTLPVTDSIVVSAFSTHLHHPFVPLYSVIGGLAAQEVVKALTGKFTPLTQWLMVDVFDLAVDSEPMSCIDCQLPTKYSSLHYLLGHDVLASLLNLKVFMVGCGAIGCELLKLCALTGVGTKTLHLTDNDLIETSNLNRQFLFRREHVQKPKSHVAAEVISKMNPDLRMLSRVQKVCPETEQNIFNDKFFERFDVVLNALDNVEARLYMDTRCVQCCKPLIESGTLATKAHVQVIVPFMTETYSSQRDPPEEEAPMCTVKSFPTIPEHAVQWARNKFESMFTQSAQTFNKFWSEHDRSVSDVRAKYLDNQSENELVRDVYKAIKIMLNRPCTMDECIVQAHTKLVKYFDHAARHLLNAFPLDHTSADGTPFWQLPKRPPTPQTFDADNQMHMQFVASMSRLHARMYGIECSPSDTTPDHIRHILGHAHSPQFRPLQKHFSVSDEDSADASVRRHHISSVKCLESIDARAPASLVVNDLEVIEFEKDDDLHIDFIDATAHLRCLMYGLQPVDRFEAKRIAGHIVPAIATTTAAVAGLVFIELCRYVKWQQQQTSRHSSIEYTDSNLPQSDNVPFRNWFLNLAQPSLLPAQPAPPARLRVASDLRMSVWEKCYIRGHPLFTLTEFCTEIQTKYGHEVRMVSRGNKLVYADFMAAHKDRLDKSVTVESSVELIVDIEDDDDAALMTECNSLTVKYYTGIESEEHKSCCN